MFCNQVLLSRSLETSMLLFSIALNRYFPLHIKIKAQSEKYKERKVSWMLFNSDFCQLRFKVCIWHLSSSADHRLKSYNQTACYYLIIRTGLDIQHTGLPGNINVYIDTRQ